MNVLLGATRQDSLSSSGPMSRLIAESIPDRDPEPFLASLFWSQFIQTSLFRQTTARFAASSNASLIVVGHADGTRYDLLLLDSAYRGEPQAEDFRHTSLEINDGRLDPGMVKRVLRRAGNPDNLAPEQVSESVNELAENRKFGLVIAQAPEELPTFSLSPALALKNGKQESVATIGVISIRESGRVVATTADHAVADRTQLLTVDGRRMSVIGRHAGSDSCLLAIPEESINNLRWVGLEGPLRGVPPTTYSEASFDGATSGLTKTTVMGFDLSVIDPYPNEMSKIYTEPHTSPGDSGAALVDSSDHIIGFSYRRSSYDAKLKFSAWVWAEQVCIAHGLFGCVDLAPLS